MKPVRGSMSAGSAHPPRTHLQRHCALKTAATRLQSWGLARTDGGDRPRHPRRKASRSLVLERLEGRELLAITTVDLASGEIMAEDLAAALSGPGVSVSNVQFTGDGLAAGLFSNGTGTGLGIPSGVVLSTGKISDAIDRNSTGSMSTGFGTPGDPDLDVLSGKEDEEGFEETQDAAVLEFDLETTGETLSFYYIFGSEEYLGFVGEGYNDVFGFFVDGVNIALVPGSSDMVSVDTINPNSNPLYFRDNTGAKFNLEANGFTANLQATINLEAGSHRIKLAIADVGDSDYDSWVFLGASTFVSGQADLSITQSAEPAIPRVGSVQTYTLTITNPGPDDATNVIVEDILAQEILLVDIAASQGEVTEVNGIVTANLGTIAAGEIATIGIQVIPAAVGQLTNFARVISAEYDSNLANNATTLIQTAASPVVPGFDSTTLHPNDDQSSTRVTLPFEINFYGNRYTSLFVNNNGNVTFDRSFGTYTPFALTSRIRTPIIAPFFADLDTRAPAGSDGAPPQFAESIGTVTYGAGTYEGRTAFGVSYTGAGYYDRRWDKLNTFQILLVERSDRAIGDFDIVFNYDQIQWDAGELSLESPAVVGFSNGSGLANTFFQLDGSLRSGAFLDSSSTGLIHGSRGSDVLGRYVFQIRDGFFEGNNEGWRGTQGFTEVAVTVSQPLDPAPVSWTVNNSFFVGLLSGTTRLDLIDNAQFGIVSVNSQSREIHGTGEFGPDPLGFFVEDPSVASLDPHFDVLPLSPASVDQWFSRSSDESWSDSLLAMIPTEHEEVALQEQLVSISGQVWQDKNGDGLHDRSEQRIIGRLVFIDRNRNGVLDHGEQHTSSDINGRYQFSEIHLEDDDYLVRVALDAKDSSPAGASEPKEIRISQQNRNLANIDFALAAPSAAVPDADGLVVAGTSRWTIWLAGVGAAATLCGTWLLGCRWRRKRAATYAVWHTRIAAQLPSQTGPNVTSLALEDTVRDTGEPHVSKTIR